MSANDRCEHGRRICSECIIVSDAAKRAYDNVRAFATFTPWDERIRGWLAIRLEDGSTDGTLYGSKRDAIRHQSNEFLCAYFTYRNAPNGFSSAVDAALWLEYHRAAYDAGFRLPDPDDVLGGPDLIVPTTLEQMHLQKARLIGGS